MLKNIILFSFIPIIMGSSCLHSQIDYTFFRSADETISQEIENSAERCFDFVDSSELSDREAYDSWENCMSNFFRLESLLEDLRDALFLRDKNRIRESSLAIIDYMILLNLDVPEGFLDYVEELE